MIPRMLCSCFELCHLDTSDHGYRPMCFFFNDPATTEIYTLSLHDALPIYWHAPPLCRSRPRGVHCGGRSEEHTSELQSHSDLVCRLLLEKKKRSRKQRRSFVRACPVH